MLKTIAKLLGAASPDEMRGLRLETNHDYWVLEGDTDLSIFLRALSKLIFVPAFLYFEGGSPDGELAEWIDHNMIDPPDQVARGTVWPRCEVFHLPLTESIIEELALISERIPHPELAIHIHVYTPGRMLLEWHDAFDNPMLIDGGVAKDTVTDFASAIGFNVTRHNNSEQNAAEQPASRPAVKNK